MGNCCGGEKSKDVALTEDKGEVYLKQNEVRAFLGDLEGLLTVYQPADPIFFLTEVLGGLRKSGGTGVMADGADCHARLHKVAKEVHEELDGK